MVDYNNTIHNIKIVPRFIPTGTIQIELTNEGDNVTTTLPVTYVYLDGYLDFVFNFNFEEKNRYSYKITQEEEVVYRGKFYAEIKTNNYRQDIYEY